MFDSLNVWIDASTVNECYRSISAGINVDKILLTSQEVPSEGDLKNLVGKGLEYNATSLLQLENYGKAFPGSGVSVRFNTGKGSSYKKNTSTGGKNSSFGIYNQRN